MVEQLLAHMIGDYVFQSHGMATKKTQSIIVAFYHAWAYAIPFVLFFHDTITIGAWLVIFVTHALIDRYRIAKYVCWMKNNIFDIPGSAYIPWKDVRDTNGFPADTPPYLSMWLMIIVDNMMHVGINAAALKFLT